MASLPSRHADATRSWLSVAAVSARLVARLVLTLLIMAAVLLLAPMLFGGRTATVVTGSMAPAIRPGDVVLLSGQPRAPLHVGQIIAFRNAADRGVVVVHRIAAIRGDDVVTRGDANQMVDSTPVSRRDVIGVVRLRVPYLGLPLTLGRGAQLIVWLLSGLSIFVLALVAQPFRPASGSGVKRSGLIRRAGVSALLAAVVPVTGMHALAAFANRTTNPTNTFTASSQFNNYPQQVLSDGPSLYYRQDDSVSSTTASDSSGNGSDGFYAGSTGVYRQPGSPAGATDTAVAFPGNSINSHAYSDTRSSPTRCTVELWFKTTTTSGGKLIGFGDNQAGNSFAEDREIGMRNDGRLQSFAGATKLTSPAAYNDGNWHMAAMSVGADGEALYVDGSLVASATVQTSGQTFSGFWRIGGDSFFDATSYYITATIDEASVYTSQISATRIAAHYAAATDASTYTASVLSDDPWGFWHLDDDGPASGSTAVMVDSSANNHPGHYVNLPAKTPTGGQSGALSGSQSASTAMRFAGTGNGYAPASVNNPTVFSLECWFNTTSATGGELMGFGSSQSGDSASYDRNVYMRNDGKLTFGIYDGSTHTLTSAAAYNDGEWHQVISTLGAAGSALYVDGAAVASNTTSPGGPENHSGYWRWGGDNLNGWPLRPTTSYFTGTMDEVAVYPSQLTASEVGLHYGAAVR